MKLLNQNHGFTLIEVLVATAVASIILLMAYGSYTTISKAIANLTIQATFYENINLIIYRMNRDFSCAYFDRYKEKLFFIGENEYGDKNLGKVNFVTINMEKNRLAGNLIQNYPVSDVIEVGYYLKQMEKPDSKGNYNYYLIRCSDITYDGDPETAAVENILLENVIDMKFEFGVAKRFTSKWDSKQYKRFPNSVKTTLTVLNPNGNEETFVFLSYINLSR